MPTIAFEGPAGTGKTYNLMKRLADAVREQGLQPHERVLALTYMHGSRRRLATRLQEIDGLGGKFYATTLDKFAYQLCRRWSLLAKHIGQTTPHENDYDLTCEYAAGLLKRPVVKSWVRTSFPHLVVDEAQDLSTHRSEMIREMARACHVLLAFDEFQCLSPDLRPMPIGTWLHDDCDLIRLDQCYRTQDDELLQAARAVRDGESVESGRKFHVEVTPARGSYAFPATYLANFINWRKGGNVAVLTPSRKGGFADGIVSLVKSKALGKKGSGPFSIRWQQSGKSQRESLWKDLNMPAECSISEALDHLDAHMDLPVVKDVRRWIVRRRSVSGVSRIDSVEVRNRFDYLMEMRKHYRVRSEPKFSAMTIQQAKNREFDHVVVIWPYTVWGDTEQKRRLLYNAITRAKRSCLVLVQHRKLRNAAPFVRESDRGSAVAASGNG